MWAISSHAESYEFRLIEGLRNLPGEDGVDGADDHEEDWVAEGDHVGQVY